MVYLRHENRIKREGKPLIELENVVRSFKIVKRKSGFRGTLKNLFAPETEIKRAVNNLSFTIPDGQMVGFIGPNGAGKSTTVKMLSGVLYPDSGSLRVNGFVPHRDRKKYVRHIGVVFGQRSQLWQDLPITDSFEMLKSIYKIPDEIYRTNIELFNEILSLHTFENKQVRQLSLGQRMRADIAAAFLHNPDIIFLDEPTIGLDVVVKENVRAFIKSINEQRGCTVIFTTHDMQDIEKVCKRILIIDEGALLYDGTTEKLRDVFGEERVLTVSLNEKTDTLTACGIKSSVDAENPLDHIFRVPKQIKLPEMITEISAKAEIADLRIKEPEIEAIIRRIYEKGAADA
ncbi:MAG: ATP-binding cassette domain-containing protein [Ruminococcus sp.]|jgi:ABC-2 type transport system ATP-binding protein|nr:ATP-binding cassette domain-containing protein [Ruminococcus sp.]